MTMIISEGRNRMNTFTIYLMKLKNSWDKIYIWLSEPNNGSEGLMDGNNILFSDNRQDKGAIHRKRKMARSKK